ncbi:PPP family 3-phenylpropionic acid transporter [Desulfobotulus alkaliphilus]|uniref:PPP family 3-phenylpropionic acid transporter n=1 Tax=Desulfobotulus alkaliphilus TaxID=622671 RepID=A0A562S2F2_9BACT|nr:MFS transporter [Desulfobotulus alkaliphilus]TWI75547.1 PPP family 3-phenylpropionic acid transporter [Desulfobotulus alkaliphilus]
MQLYFFKNNFFLFSGNYFFYFLVLGVYFPYFPLYCHYAGFSENQIGIITALKTFSAIFFPLIWAWIADRFHMHRSVFLLCHFSSFILWGFFFLTESFLMMLLIMLVYGLFHSPLIGFTEAFTVGFLGGKKSGYGNIRLWGSVGFIIAVWGCGIALDFLSPSIVLWLVFSGSLAGAWLAVYTPVKKNSNVRIYKKDIIRLFSGNSMVFLLVTFIMLMSHGVYYGFFSIHLSKAGFSGNFIGFVWAMASIAEIFVMLGSRYLFYYFSLKSLILFSFAAAVLRWCLLAFSIDPMVIVLSQLLHAITYGVFHMTTILYMDILVDAGAKTIGQTVLNASSYGLGLMVGYLVGGMGFAALGSDMFLVSAIMAFSGGVLAMGLHSLKIHSSQGGTR